jgi:HD-GYP domain-containing protein (c-di-GMP phosphodiesterase class II)
VNPTTASRVSYVWGPPTILLALLTAIAARLPLPGWSSELLLSAVIWLALIALAESTPVALAGWGPRVRLTPMFDFGALLCFSAVPAAALAGLGRLIAAALTGRPMRSALREAFEAMLAIGIAGVVYFERGGTTGVAVAHAPIPFAAAVITGGVFALVSAGLAAWRFAALRDRPGTTPPMAAREQLLATVLMLPFGVAFAWLESTAGAAAGICAVVLVLMSRTLERATSAATIVAHPAEATATAHASVSGKAGPDPELETVRLLMSAIDAFDPFTRGHSARIAFACTKVARQLGLPAEEIDQTEYAALLHDIGRTAIHLDILTRPGTLSGEEREVLHTHPTVGRDIINRIPGLESAAAIVYAHHEQPDGRGYPRGLRGDAIPVGSRIIMVAAAFDAMTRERPYRRGLTAAAAYEELRRHAGTQFFGDVVEAYVTLHASGALEPGPEDETIAPSGAADSGDASLNAA